MQEHASQTCLALIKAKLNSGQTISASLLFANCLQMNTRKLQIAARILEFCAWGLLWPEMSKWGLVCDCLAEISESFRKQRAEFCLLARSLSNWTWLAGGNCIMDAAQLVCAPLRVFS